MTGPYETERKVRELPAVRAVYDAFRADPGPGKMAPHCRRILDEACSAAGVETCAYDDRILTWLAGWGPETCAVAAGLISRASQPGRDDPARPVTVRMSRADLGLILDALTDASRSFR